MFHSILIVCVGNICRSPMAEALMREAAPAQVRLASAGIGALVDQPADPMAIELMRARGIDLTGHRARQLTSAMVRQADLVLVMEERHREHVHAMLPVARGKVHLLGKWQQVEIPDPYRKDKQAFVQALQLIEQGVEAWSRRIWGGEGR
ncbi:MAG: low molecular weight phosphotyrosine protein phosphatase [Zetaproteobacteria bacterium]|nr:MAG: low molecular weight phosphotyrosine protein phosphatase [Zetaproteobacteria bacterium]